MASAQSLGNSSSSSLPVLKAPLWHAPLTSELLDKLADLLPAFIATRRWFRAKARTITRVLIEDVVPFAEYDSWLLVLLIEYAEGEADKYLLPVSLTAQDDSGEQIPESAEPFAYLHSDDGKKGTIHSAFANGRFRNLILNAIGENQSFEGRNGTLLASRTSVAENMGANGAVELDSFVSRAEQSNTSIIFGDQYILKLFRKVEPGINPDVEVGKFLTEHGFANTPAVLGTLEYRSRLDQAPYAAGILQRFIRNQGDAWKYTLDQLGGYFGRAIAKGGDASAADSAAVHPLERMSQPVPSAVGELVGEYLTAAALLGKRTAEMHTVLASEGTDPNFAPEPFNSADAEKLHSEMLAQADVAFDVLRLKRGTLRDADAESASRLLSLESTVRERFAQLKNSAVSAQRIRFHGDYHLGQVLYTGDDFMIIDFEGEPARPLSERRHKTICLRDVAGMVRSFQYAGFASLFGQVPGLPAGDPAAIDSAATLWTSWVTASYLKGYFEAAGEASFLPQSTEERRLLLDAFLLHKALYEVAYELNNRPDWVRIPLRGILSLVQ